MEKTQVDDHPHFYDKLESVLKVTPPNAIDKTKVGVCRVSIKPSYLKTKVGVCRVSIEPSYLKTNVGVCRVSIAR